MNLGQEKGVQNFVFALNRNSQSPVMHNWDSPLAQHTSQWRGPKLASGLSLIAFILLLIMAFSTKWLYLSSSRFYQRWPTNVTRRIYTSAVIMSMGLLWICRSEKCPISENGKGETLFPWPPAFTSPFIPWCSCPLLLVILIVLAGKMTPLAPRWVPRLIFALPAWPMESVTASTRLKVKSTYKNVVRGLASQCM